MVPMRVPGRHAHPQDREFRLMQPESLKRKHHWKDWLTTWWVAQQELAEPSSLPAESAESREHKTLGKGIRSLNTLLLYYVLHIFSFTVQFSKPPYEIGTIIPAPPPFSTWENWGTEKLSNSPKVTQILSTVEITVESQLRFKSSLAAHLNAPHPSDEAL